MATKNPFGNLKINRDDDDDEDFVKVTEKNTTSASNFTSNTEMKKKKKVRPEEKPRTEVTTVSQSQDDTEGFQVVGKTKQRNFTSSNNNEETEEKKDNREKKHKGTNNYDRVQNKTRPHKRQFEKQSGTGRGRETAKNGAGGKTVWGDNPNQIAREARKEGRVDYFFETVLNPKKEEVVEEQVQEEVKETVVEEPQVEQTIERPVEEPERRKKVVAEEEIPPEERLDRPEGALSLAEYREQLKEKNRNILGSAKPQPTLNHTSNLQVIEKETIKAVEKKSAKKAKKVDNSVQQINVNFRTEDNNSYVNYRNQNNQQQKKTQPKAKINFDDLPSL